MIPHLLLKTYYDGTTIFRLSLIEGCTKKAMLSTPLSIYIEKTTLSKESLFGKHCDQKCVHLTEVPILESEIDTYSFRWKFLSINFHLFQNIQLDDFDSLENKSCCVLRATPHVVTWKLPNSITKFTKKSWHWSIFVLYITIGKELL